MAITILVTFFRVGQTTMVRVILYAEHLVSALTIPTSAYAHVSAPHLASVITVIFNINVIIVVGNWIVNTGGMTCIIGMEKVVIRADSITGLCFINSLTSGTHRIHGIPTSANSIIGARVSSRETATLGTVPF